MAPPFTRWRGPGHHPQFSQLTLTRARDLRAFLSWVITSGTALLGTVNLRPLPPSVVTLSEAQIATIEG